MSEIRAVLVHADATAGSATRLEIGRELATRHGAAVTALFGATVDTDRLSSAYSAGAALGSGASDWGALARDTARAELEQRGRGGEGAEVAWFDIAGDSITRAFIAEAAYADLLVVGQQSPGEAAGGAPEGFVESVILDSGKPTLVVPGEPRAGSVGERALIAWNGSAQAARAVTGALPILQRARVVDVAIWSRHPVAGPFSGIDIVSFLRGHGVEAVLHLSPPSSHVGQELATLAQALRADLVVMGCYGRSRATERVLGGATRSVLATLPVPMLMAH